MVTARARWVFLFLVLVQGFHELEHVVQVIQRYELGIPNGNGLVGSLADIEPVHFVYNTVYLGLLAAVFVLLGLPKAAGRLGLGVSGLLTFALVFQSWHEVEHVFKIAQYLTLHLNGTGGVFGQGPGALLPLFPIPLLHLAYNTVAYVPALIAFVAVTRASSTASAESHAHVPPRRRSRVMAIAAIGLVCVAIVVSVSIGVALARRTPPDALSVPRFVDVTATAGIDHVYAGGFEYAVGGGVAVLDCAGNGKPDLYLAGGSNPAALYRNDSPVGGELHFTRLPDPATDLSSVIGAYPIDIDGDGITDLVVLRNGETVLLRGLGGCRFERANERWGFDGGASITTAFSATWEAAATLPTLAFGRYVDPASNDPRHLCLDNVLVRPASTGTTYAPPIALTPSWCALSILFSDWSRSGRMDLRVSNDRQYYLSTDGQEQLWRIAPHEAPHLYTADDGWVSIQLNGMGIASYDVSGTGYPDVFLTSMGDNRLQTLAGGPSRPTYRDIGLKRGVNAAQPFTGGDLRPSTAWHAEFGDVGNDGHVDLFISKGNVIDEPDAAQRDPSNLLLGQADGTFREAADIAGILTFDRGRGAALTDLNLSGMLDLIQVNYGSPVRIWRNVGSGTASQPRAMGNWLEVGLVQPAPNVDAIGAWVEVRLGDRVLRQERTVGGGHAGGQLGWSHFGLGSAAGADVRVVWPGGETGPWLHVSANEFVVVTRGPAGARPWSPGESSPRTRRP